MTEEEFWRIVKAQGKVVDTDQDGTTTVEVPTGEDRSQLIRVALKDFGVHLGVCAAFGSLIGEVGDLDCERALRLNATAVKFGAIAIMDDMVLLRETLRLDTCDSDEIMFTIAEMAGVADRLEQDLYDSDRF